MHDCMHGLACLLACVFLVQINTSQLHPLNDSDSSLELTGTFSTTDEFKTPAIVSALGARGAAAAAGAVVGAAAGSSDAQSKQSGWLRGGDGDDAGRDGDGDDRCVCCVYNKLLLAVGGCVVRGDMFRNLFDIDARYKQHTRRLCDDILYYNLV